MKAFIVANWKHWVLLLAVGTLKALESAPPLAGFKPLMDDLALFLSAGGILGLPQVSTGKSDK
jgi:hypothetical protein